MNNHKKTLKTVVFSLGLAVLMAPATLNAQINRGLLENPYKQDNSHKSGGLMNTQGTRGSIDDGGNGFTIETFGDQTTPLSSGIAIMMGLGLGYVALKKKEDEQ